MNDNSVLLNDRGERFVSVGDICCLFSVSLIDALTGMKSISPRPWKIHGIATDASFFVFGKAPHYRTWWIAADARELGQRLIDFFLQLPMDTAPYPVIVDLAPDGEIVASVGRRKVRGSYPRKENADAKLAECLTCDLRYGVQLIVRNTSGQMSVSNVADFLAEALKHFKHQRDNLKATIYTGGPYCQTAKQGGKIRGETQLSCTNAEGLSLDLWTDSVTHAYSIANTVEQMREALPQWQQAAERDGGYFSEVVGLLAKPSGDLLAMAAMVRHALQV